MPNSMQSDPPTQELSNQGGRLAFFLPVAEIGGFERVVINLARGLLELGTSVDVVFGSATPEFLQLLPGGVRRVDLRCTRALLSIPGLIRYLRRERPDWLLSGAEHASAIAIFAGRSFSKGTRLIVSQNTEFSRGAQFAYGLRGRLALRLAAALYPWADGYVAVSQGVAEDLTRVLRRPRAAVRMIYNPVLTPEIAAMAKEPVEHRWFQAGNPPVILSAGRLVPQKDFPTLIRAFAEVRRSRLARLLVLGDGFERPRLDALVRQLGLSADVEFAAALLNPYKYMARAAVFALSSAWEGLSNVLVEALSVGAGVVSTDAPSGPAEVLGFGRYGRLVPVGDWKALADAILAALAEPAPCLPAAALERFDYRNVARQYRNFLDELKVPFLR